MNTINLTFRGKVLPGYDPDKVKAAFARYFNIDDPARIEQLFNGTSTVMRRGLDRKTAASAYVEIHKMGIDISLARADKETLPPAPVVPARETPSTAEPAPSPDIATAKTKPRGMDHEIKEAQPGRIDQSWPVSGGIRAAQKSAESAVGNKQARLAAAKARSQQPATGTSAKHTEPAHMVRKLEQQKKAVEKARIHSDQKREKAARKADLNAKKAAEAARVAQQKSAQKAAAEVEEKRRRQEKEVLKERARRSAAEQQQRKESAKQQAAAAAQKQHEEKLQAKRAQADQSSRARQRETERKREEAQHIAAEKAERKRRHVEEFALLKQRKATERAEREARTRAVREKAAQEILALEALQSEQRRLEAEALAEEKAGLLAQLEQEQVRVRVRVQGKESLTAIEASATVTEKTTTPAPDSRREAGNQLIRTSLQPVTETVKATPIHGVRKTPDRGAGQRVKRSTGAANLFALRPFRNSAEVRIRAERSQGFKQIAIAVCLVSLLALVTLAARYYSSPALPGPNGAKAMSVDSHSNLALVAGDTLFLHDRAGVSTDTIPLRELALTDIGELLAHMPDGSLLLRGTAIAGENAVEATPAPTLYTCQLAERTCTALQLPAKIQSADAVAVEARSGNLYLASTLSGTLFKLSRTGEILAARKMAVPAAPTLRLEFGLLYLSSIEGAAISVYRPDNAAFGQQLDEILLLPPPAIASGQTLISNFIWSAGSWWVSLYNPQTLDAGLYRFDEQWNFADQAQLDPGPPATALANWADKTLALNNQTLDIARFNMEGSAELPLRSATVTAYITALKRTEQRVALLWQASLLALTLIVIGALLFAGLHRLRAMVYRSKLEKGAPPISDQEASICWIEPAADNAVEPRTIAIAYLCFSLMSLLFCVALMVSPFTLLAILVFLAGPAIAYFLMLNSPRGHIGNLSGQLLLVDHRNLYHLGKGPKILHRKHFLMLDDVVVYTGTTLSPRFNSLQMHREIAPLVSAGIKVDRWILAIKLLESGHPAAKAVLTLCATTLISLALFVLA